MERILPILSQQTLFSAAFAGTTLLPYHFWNRFISSLNMAANKGEGPSNWEVVYHNIKEMRKDNTAPVDTMGCDRCCDDDAPPKIRRFQALVALLLSSQTKDQVTFAAMERLKAHGLTPANIITTDANLLKGLIKPVGFYNKKAENLKKVSEILIKDYDSDIPNTIGGLMELPGIGPKMGYICLKVAWGINAGIGVDTHVHRISERLGWVPAAKGARKNTPEDTRKALEDWLPQDLWQEVNAMLVGFGQTICLPTRPKCGECLNQEICPVGKKTLKK